MSRTSMSRLGKWLLVLPAIIFLAGCSAPEPQYLQRMEPDEPEFTYNTSISRVPIQISRGNLHWHKQLPDNNYTLEDMAIEIYNYGDFDVTVTQMEIRIDENGKLFNIDMVIPGSMRESMVIQPMMEGYDGGTHLVSVTLLGEKGETLCEGDRHEVGPLEPVPGTGNWEPVPDG